MGSFVPTRAGDSALSTNSSSPTPRFALISLDSPSFIIVCAVGVEFFVSLYYFLFKRFIMPVFTLRQDSSMESSLNETRSESTTSLRVDLIVTVSICLFLTTSAVGARVFTKALDLKHVQLEDCKNYLNMPHHSANHLQTQSWSQQLAFLHSLASFSRPQLPDKEFTHSLTSFSSQTSSTSSMPLSVFSSSSRYCYKSGVSSSRIAISSCTGLCRSCSWSTS